MDTIEFNGNGACVRRVDLLKDEGGEDFVPGFVYAGAGDELHGLEIM